MNLKLFATDLDYTLVGNATYKFAHAWQNNERLRSCLLCYNTGRAFTDTLQFIDDESLPEPDFIISGVGTHIFDYKKKQVLKQFAELLEEEWDKDKINDIMGNLEFNIVKQPSYCQNTYKSSWYLEGASSEQIHQIEKLLQQSGLSIRVVYSGDKDLDILPQWANKGNALIWLLKHCRVSALEAIVAGDSGNDMAMFMIPQISGIIVGNAQPELYQATKHLPVYHAEGECAQGILEGFVHYGLLSEEWSQMEDSAVEKKIEPVTRHIAESQLQYDLENEQRQFIKIAYKKAIDALKKNVTVLGFSPYAIRDNEILGLDEEYRSVWSRDGAIAAIGSMALVDDEIRNARRQTFKTILRHVTLNGQVPVRVCIKDGRPDYSGQGRLCSIDSGLWLIIAFYELVRTSKDIEFLRRYAVKLQMIMNWLSAHDSNNDALLEIPEASDWTGLLGRSYNVLYDEVLWYYANVCYARLVQLLGDENRAGDYFRWSQIIKKEIIANFWPVSGTNLDNIFDRGYTASNPYLIAQLTPFDTDWRCDIFANVLAFLFNVIDHEKAQSAFRFIWGCGVNSLYPIANIYPTIHPGDQNWKGAHAVNPITLVNLPHHYHNGGIWPLVGGHWVRFLNKVGLRDLALQDLYRLAELNKLGITRDWEFNEWVHAKTGRPMGKCYCACSATEFIHAYHSMNLNREAQKKD